MFFNYTPDGTKKSHEHISVTANICVLYTPNNLSIEGSLLETPHHSLEFLPLKTRLMCGRLVKKKMDAFHIVLLSIQILFGKGTCQMEEDQYAVSNEQKCVRKRSFNCYCILLCCPLIFSSFNFMSLLILSGLFYFYSKDTSLQLRHVLDGFYKVRKTVANYKPRLCLWRTNWFVIVLLFLITCILSLIYMYTGNDFFQKPRFQKRMSACLLIMLVNMNANTYYSNINHPPTMSQWKTQIEFWAIYILSQLPAAVH